MNEQRVLEERYIAAAASSHLRLSLEQAGAVDLLISAGWVRDGLATGLYRLRGEFDNAKATIRQQQTRYNDLHAQANARRRAAGKHDEEAASLCAQAETEALTARALILMQLKSLDGVTRALRHFGEKQASRRGFGGDNVHRVTGHALDLMLDPLCPHCDGVGFFGGFGKAKTLCTKCRGSTRRRVDFGSIEAQAFGVFILADMERKLARVEGLMLKFLARARAGEDLPLDQSLVSSSAADLKRRLVELRGQQANAD